MTTDPFAPAAGLLAAYWRRADIPDANTRQIYSRIAQAVDPDGTLAASVRGGVEGTARVAGTLRRAVQDNAWLAPLVQQLAPAPARQEPTHRVRQDVTVSGNGNSTLLVGRDFAPSGPVNVSAGAPAPAAASDPETKPVPAEPADTILVAAADPVDLDRLRLGREEREIREALELSGGRGRWAVHPRNAVRLRDLTRALLELRPRIVHFSGHGGGKADGVFLEDEAGNACEVPPDALADLFATVDRRVECVVLNACYSQPQARAISAHVPFVVGTPGAITDEAAVAFSVGFYQTLGAGCAIPQAYRLGCVQMRGAGTAGLPLPVLLERS
ncbi:MAG TPA: CHAT domain-containing protein [Longimicrobium sp.]|jgi:hypothetical protein